MSRGRSPRGDLTATPNLWRSGLVEVDLPSGLSVRGVRPTLAELIRHGLLPTSLRAAALHFADPAWLEGGENVADEELARRGAERVALTRLLVASFPRQVRLPGGEWQEDTTPIDDRIAAIERRDVDPLDYDLLEDVVFRIRTPEEASEMARLIRGGADPEEAVPADTSDERFREEPGGAQAGHDGEALGGVVPFPDVPRSRRPGARVRA